MRRNLSADSRGFTIIELMISLSIFSMILLVVLTAITQIGRMYYKGVTAARTQNSTRLLVNRISQEIQFSDAAIVPTLVVSKSGNVHVLCMGKSRFFYRINTLNNDENGYGVWVDDASTGASSDPCARGTLAGETLDSMQIPTEASGGQELLHDNARLLALSVNKTGGSWTVNARVATGEDEMFEAYDNEGKKVEFASNPQLGVCKGSEIGTQFCSVSELTSTVTKRL